MPKAKGIAAPNTITNTITRVNRQSSFIASSQMQNGDAVAGYQRRQEGRARWLARQGKTRYRNNLLRQYQLAFTGAAQAVALTVVANDNFFFASELFLGVDFTAHGVIFFACYFVHVRWLGCACGHDANLKPCL